MPLTRELPLLTVIKAALIAGVVAGLAAAAFHFLATESLIDRAIALETLRLQAEGAHEEPMVSRETQRIGLFIGFLLFGLTWSLLFGAIYQLAQRWLPEWTTPKRALLMAAAGYWAVALFPFLKYPSSPPGVGDPDTIGYRQALYLAALGLSLLGTILAFVLARARGWRPALAFLAVYAILLYVVLPANRDAITMPADIVSTFRVLSIAGLTLFWAVLGLTFGRLLQREATPAVRQQSLRVA